MHSQNLHMDLYTRLTADHAGSLTVKTLNLTLSQVAIKWLVLGWVIVCRQANSAFHPSVVGKSSTGLSGCD